MPFVCGRLEADDPVQRNITLEEIVMTYAILSLIEAIEVLLGYRARRSCSVPSRPD